MNKVKTINLGKVVEYSKERISCDKINPSNYIGTDNLLQNKQGKIDASYIPKIGASTKYIKGNILVGNIRPYLKKIWYAENDGGSSADVLTFKVNKKYNPRYVYYALFRDDFFVHMMKGSKGTKMPRGDKNQILDFIIPDFELPIQDDISDILFKIDNKIKINNQVNTILEQIAKTLYDYWFVQFDFPDSLGKPYKSNGGSMSWSEELKRDIPKGWVVKKVGNLVDVKRGKNITRKTIISGNIPVIAAGLAPSCYHNKSNTRSPVITISGSGANAGFVQLHNEEIWASDCSYINRTMIKEIYFLFIFLKKRQDKILDMQKGSAQPHVYPKDIMDIKIETDQESDIFLKFEAIVSPMFEMIGENIKENKKLAELRDLLLPMLMNGQVTIKE